MATKDALSARPTVKTAATKECQVLFQAVEGHDRLLEEVAVIQELLWTEETFAAATPGSAAQFRARESADALQMKLHGLRSRC